MFCRIQGGSTAFPVIIRERNIKEDTFEALASVCANSINPLVVFMFTFHSIVKVMEVLVLWAIIASS